MTTEAMKKQQPGSLQILVDLVLDTKEATNLFYGRKETKDLNAIIGLEHFAQRVKYINNAARNDDPYADYFLLEVESSLMVAKDELDTLATELNHLLKDKSLLRVNTGKSLKPVKLTTDFSAVYANMALDLLKKADTVFFTIHILAHIGVYTRVEKNNKLEYVKKLIRRTFLSQQGYKFFNINRQDVSLMTARGVEAHTAMRFTENLSQEIIDKKLRAKHAPNIAMSNDEFFKRPTTEQKDGKDDNEDKTTKEKQ